MLDTENLFKRIIIDLGVGAKTNAGHGVSEEVADIGNHYGNA